MPARTSRLAFVLSAWFISVQSALCAAAEPPRPALVVVISVDQWCYEYFDRFQENLADNGIVRWSQERGVWCTNCLHGHAFTYTAPGHAVQLTGCYPNRHGIIDNQWYVRGEQRQMYCVEDSEAKLIGAATADKPVSPRTLLSDTLGDQMKLATGGRSKVFGVAIKDRAAILMAGRAGDAAFWMSKEGDWITSDYYTGLLPGYLRQLNEQKALHRYAGQSWELVYEAARYRHGDQEDSFGERPAFGMTADFPHVIAAADANHFVNQVACSPFGNEATLEAARDLLVHEALGQDDAADLLAVNLSSNDYVGHAFGPHSLEVEDMTYRTDLQLGEFARFIDQQLGQRPWVLFVTSDHGVAPIPEVADRLGLPAARDPLGKSEGRGGNLPTMQQGLEEYLQQQLSLAEPRPLVEAFVGNQVFLHADAARDVAGGSRRLQELACHWIRQQPAIRAAYSRHELLTQGAPDSDPLRKLAQRAFHASRSGDIVFMLAPYHLQGGAGTTHGSPWHYDRHIPLMVVGDVRPARIDRPVSPASIAATAAALLGVSPPAMAEEPALAEVEMAAGVEGAQ